MSGFSHPLEDLIICAFTIYLGRRYNIVYGTPVKLDTPRPNAGPTKMPDYLIPGPSGQEALVEMKRVGPSLQRYAALSRFVRNAVKNAAPRLADARYYFLFVGSGIPPLPTIRNRASDTKEVRLLGEAIAQTAKSASESASGSYRHKGPPCFSVHRIPGHFPSTEVETCWATDDAWDKTCGQVMDECEQKFEAASKKHAASTRAVLLLSDGGFYTADMQSDLRRRKAEGRLICTTDVCSVYVSDKGLDIEHFWPRSRGHAGTLYPVERHSFLKEWRHLLRSYFKG
jgi:hypothetical protein